MGEGNTKAQERKRRTAIEKCGPDIFGHYLTKIKSSKTDLINFFLPKTRNREKKTITLITI